jgi:hypothetical protein
MHGARRIGSTAVLLSVITAQLIEQMLQEYDSKYGLPIESSNKRSLARRADLDSTDARQGAAMQQAAFC